MYAVGCLIQGKNIWGYRDLKIWGELGKLNVDKVDFGIQEDETFGVGELRYLGGGNI